MKNKLPAYTLGLTALGLLMHSPSAHALSFVQGTIFLDAKTESECRTLGGNFMEWYEEIYCTKNPEVSRAEFLQTILESRQDTSIQCRRAFNYTDVDWSAHYADALQVASCSNIVQGNPDGTFKPGQPIAYAEAAKIVTLAFELPMTREMHPTWYGGYIQTLNRLGAAPRESIQPGDTLTPMEMNHIINTLNKNMTDSADYIGLTVEEAQALAEKNETTFRVVTLDGQPLPMTLDYRPGRINASIENNLVVDYSIEGQEEPSEAAADYIGLTVEDAQLLASQNDTPFRVVMRDGQPLPVTMDFRIGRINATVENDIVISYEVEGQETAAPVPAKEVTEEESGAAYTCLNNKQVTIYHDSFSLDGEFVNLEAEQVALKNNETGEVHVLTRVASASGEKYEDANGNSFWTQGEEAMVLKNGKIMYRDCETQTAEKETTTMIVTVASQKRECMGVGPMECLVVDGNNWYSDIEGFEFEAGYEYELKIEQSARPEPIPADASAYTYKLVEVMTKTAVQ